MMKTESGNKDVARIAKMISRRTARKGVKEVSMDNGWWALKCQSCGKSFEIELSGAEEVIDIAKGQACPYCQIIPHSLTGNDALNAWHHIVGFRAMPKKSP